MSVQCNRLASLPLLLSCYRGPNPTPTCASLVRDGHAATGLTSYPYRLLGHVSFWLASVSYHISNPPHSTALMVCDSPHLLSSQMVLPLCTVSSVTSQLQLITVLSYLGLIICLDPNFFVLGSDEGNQRMILPL